MSFTLWNEECLAAMRDIPDGSIDMVMCDLPYGTTACKWDTIIPFELLWAAYKRVCKKNSAIVLTASQPFTSALVMSNVKDFKHSWVWHKVFAANVMQAKYQPLKTVEDVVVFSMGVPRYNRQMQKRDSPIKAGGAQSGRAIPNLSSEEAKADWKKKVYDEKCPSSIITFSTRGEQARSHPTQKPVALMEYLIKTYSNEGDTVLDNCMGSGTTGVACGNLNRRFIGIEKDTEHGYFQIAQQRISAAYNWL